MITLGKKSIAYRQYGSDVCSTAEIEVTYKPSSFLLVILVNPPDQLKPVMKSASEKLSPSHKMPSDNGECDCNFSVAFAVSGRSFQYNMQKTNDIVLVSVG